MRAGKTHTEQTCSAAFTSSSYTEWPLSSQPHSKPREVVPKRQHPKAVRAPQQPPLPAAGDEHPRGCHRQQEGHLPTKERSWAGQMDARSALARTEAQSWDNSCWVSLGHCASLAPLCTTPLPMVALQAGAEPSGTSRLTEFTPCPWNSALTPRRWLIYAVFPRTELA